MKEHNRVFAKYAFPTVMGMLVTTLYTFVDGIFVGNFVGPNAIAAIGIVWPFLSMAIAISIMIATGGGALVSINFGRENKERAQHLFGQSITTAFVFLFIFSALCVLFPAGISRMLGANDVLLDYCVTYIRSFMIFGVFFGMAIVLNTFVNNDKNPKLALLGMISGAVTNIFLDYLFVYVFKWGLSGAAVASGIGQVVSCATLYLHFLLKKGELRFRFGKPIFDDVKKIILTGIPVFINEISTPLATIVYNFVIISRLGETGVAAFGIVFYLLTIYFCVFSGIAQGMQPPVSRYYGEKRIDMVKSLFHTALICGLFISTGLYVLMFAFSRNFIGMFTSDVAVIEIAVVALRVYGTFSLFFAMNMIIISLFQATRIPLPASIISGAKCFFFNIVFVLVLPLMIGNMGIWIAAVIGEGCTFALAYYQYRRNSKKIFLS